MYGCELTGRLQAAGCMLYIQLIALIFHFLCFWSFGIMCFGYLIYTHMNTRILLVYNFPALSSFQQYKQSLFHTHTIPADKFPVHVSALNNIKQISHTLNTHKPLTHNCCKQIPGPLAALNNIDKITHTHTHNY